MDATQAQHQHQHLPPSPPPSPPKTRRRQKHTKDSDPFLDLGDARTPIPSPSPPSSPTEEPQDPLLTRIIWTPLLFTSFLLSLFLVNRSDRARRTNSRASTFLSYFSPSAWLDLEPYQDPINTTWDRRGSSSHVEPHDAISPKHQQQQPKKRSWHLNKKIRKVARLEISDAFEMRGRVMAMMLAVLVGLAAGAWWMVRWAVSKMW